MKKTILAILALVMLLSLCACDDIYTPTEKSPVPKYDLCVDFTMAETDEVWDEASDSCIFAQSVCLPQVSSKGNARAAERINADIKAQNILFMEGASAIKNSALSLVDDNAHPDNDVQTTQEEAKAAASVYRNTAALTRGDVGALSICYDIYSYSGGAHGYTSRVSANYDSKTGEKLSLDSIAEDATLLRQLAYGYMLNISAGEKYQLNGESIFFDADLTDELQALVESDDWYFSNEGLVFFANPYELAPYGCGRIDFVIPYAAMEGLLKEEYVPAAFVGGNGMMLAEAGDKLDRSGLKMLGTLTIDENMQSVIISAEETVYSVQLVKLDNAFDANNVQNIIWYRNYMTTNEAVEIVLSIPDVLPNVMLRYTLADGTIIERGIFQSGEDGSIILTEMNFD